MSVASATDDGQLESRLWDALVIGAGPAGSMAARELSLRRLSVLLVDARSFPRSKVCGGCLNARTLASLQSCGLGSILSEFQGAPLRDVEFRVGGRNLVIPLPGGLSVTRESLDQALLQSAMAAGATFVPSATASIDPEEIDRFRIATVERPAGSIRVRARSVICADGLNRSSVRSIAELAGRVSRSSRLGLGLVFPPAALDAAAGDVIPAGRIVMAVGRGGYVGLARAEHGHLSVAAAIAPRLLKSSGSPGEAVSRILAASGIRPPFEARSAHWRGTPPLSVRPHRRSARRILLIGDAAGYVEPFTGEGIAWAVEGALAAAALAARGLQDWPPELAAEWERCYREQIIRRQWICRGMAAVLRSPVTAMLALRAARCFPHAADLLVRRINDRSRVGAPIAWNGT